MKLNSEQIRKLNLFSYNPAFVDISKDILCDFIYASRACSIIYFSPLEIELLLAYSSKNISKKKVEKLINDTEESDRILNDFDSFLFFGKLLKDAYKFSDALFLENHTFRQKKLYTLYHRYQEVLSLDVFKDLSFFKSVLAHKKILYIHFNNINDVLPFEDVLDMPIDRQEIKEYKSWFEWVDVIKMRIMIQNFDVAFISLGIYSNLLNYFIAQTLHKIAITKGVEESV